MNRSKSPARHSEARLCFHGAKKQKQVSHPASLFSPKEKLATEMNGGSDSRHLIWVRVAVDFLRVVSLSTSEPHYGSSGSAFSQSRGVSERSRFGAFTYSGPSSFLPLNIPERKFSSALCNTKRLWRLCLIFHLRGTVNMLVEVFKASRLSLGSVIQIREE